ncbi:hypothetical protein EUGRSUZ_E02264 [Eucalyptus grandis]|uniref:Uncharacterized protein n=2 Tax=Eucalyptus grandis TaxID=71139 RepID=A0ACC3KX16_EUCGR|nr:hypothetical protein EUGRSUZ_E02264 [Eucalyptus grandis]
MLDQTQPHGVGLEDPIDTLEPKVEMIRKCYSESTDRFSGPDLVKMMALDGCFIIQFLRQMAGASIMRDLLWLENQVPYFVLEDLFEMANVPKGTLALADLAFHFFSCFPEVFGNVWERRSNLKKESSHHLIKSASERAASTFLEIQFDREHSIIEIPKVTIDDDLNWILPNTVAFEQWCGQGDGHITAYAAFMGYLIHTVNDVQLLCDRKVILNHGMSNEDVAYFFGDVCKNATFYVKGSYLELHFTILNESLKYERAYLCCIQTPICFL